MRWTLKASCRPSNRSWNLQQIAGKVKNAFDSLVARGVSAAAGWESLLRRRCGGGGCGMRSINEKPVAAALLPKRRLYTDDSIWSVQSNQAIAAPWTNAAPRYSGNINRVLLHKKHSIVWSSYLLSIDCGTLNARMIGPSCAPPSKLTNKPF